MTESQPSEDERTWRRKFASRANNCAWTLSEQSSRTADEDLEMLDAAHAAMHLWSTIGTAQNIAAAQQLLGQVHALLGNAEYAMKYAEAAHQYVTSAPNEPWQLAISTAILANAARCAGNSALYRSSYRTAEELIAAMPAGPDKAIVEATLKVVPKPPEGLT
jgi:hypothetical protein